MAAKRAGLDGGGIRYRTVRGYKSEEGMMNGLGLTQWAWMVWSISPTNWTWAT